MRFLGFDISRETRTAQNPTVPLTGSAFLQFFGITDSGLASVTIESAMKVPAVWAAVSFLSRTMAALPLHAHRDNSTGSERIKGGLQTIVNEAPNSDWSSFGLRQYFWQQVFTGGRGLLWIERAGTNIKALWPFDPSTVSVAMRNGRKIYRSGGNEYASSEIIDVPFMLKADQVTAMGPIANGAKVISLALAMNDYASGFFAGGGVPPLALKGTMPTGAEALDRSKKQTMDAIAAAKQKNSPIINLPNGYELVPIAFDPDKGQLTEGQRFVVEQVGRLWNLPPVFLQDLTHGTFSNTEQQDLHLVKHLVAQWAKALEDEMNLKLFGQMNNKRYVEHNLDGLLRGDFATRMEGMSKAVQNGLLTPNEGRALDNRAPLANGDELLIQGATVPLGSQPTNNGAANVAA